MRAYARYAVPLIALLGAVAWIAPGVADDKDKGPSSFEARLSGLGEVPVISTGAIGRLRLRFDRFNDAIDFELSYRDLESDVTQAHIHIAQLDVNGGIATFLCSNLPNPPAGTEACPLRSGTVRGTITPEDVIGPAGQGVTAGEFEELRRMIRRGKTYANVHSMTFEGGEIRGQIHRGGSNAGQ